MTPYQKGERVMVRSRVPREWEPAIYEGDPSPGGFAPGWPFIRKTTGSEKGERVNMRPADIRRPLPGEWEAAVGDGGPWSVDPLPNGGAIVTVVGGPGVPRDPTPCPHCAELREEVKGWKRSCEGLAQTIRGWGLQVEANAERWSVAMPAGGMSDEGRSGFLRGQTGALQPIKGEQGATHDYHHNVRRVLGMDEGGEGE